MKQRLRRFLGITDLHDEMHELRDDLRALRALLMSHDQATATEIDKLGDLTALVAGLLGIKNEEAPATREEIEGTDPHGL